MTLRWVIITFVLANNPAPTLNDQIAGWFGTRFDRGQEVRLVTGEPMSFETQKACEAYIKNGPDVFPKIGGRTGVAVCMEGFVK